MLICHLLKPSIINPHAFVMKDTCFTTLMNKIIMRYSPCISVQWFDCTRRVKVYATFFPRMFYHAMKFYALKPWFGITCIQIVIFWPVKTTFTMYLYVYIQLTPRIRVHLEKVIVAQMVNKFWDFTGQKSSVSCSQELPPLESVQPVYFLQHYFAFTGSTSLESSLPVRFTD